jgi:hypothetical protein
MDNQINMDNDDSNYSQDDNGAQGDQNISNIIQLHRKATKKIEE